ncbi:MAG: hypothetical protein U9R19_01670 [Bacteroidota bacterium]|nr:hypothetical protein [Bacteroidota bacterium]
MKKIQIILLIIFMSVSGIMAQSGKKSHWLKPSNFRKRVTTVVSEKSRYYYSLDTYKASIINVQGPGKLRVLTRGRFLPDEGDKIKYRIRYSIDGGEEETIKISGVERSKKATYYKGSLGVPGQLKDFTIELGRGDHNIEFVIDDNSVNVAARYIFIPGKKKKHKWIAYSPMLPSDPVDLISRERIYHYYRFSKEKPLKIEINGPTELRLLSRIENHYQMKGRIQYRLQVKENGVVINTYQLSSRPSQVTEYKNNKELIPGKACEFVINVPKGRYTYEIIPLDKSKNSVLGRLLFPKKDVELKD